LLGLTGRLGHGGTDPTPDNLDHVLFCSVAATALALAMTAVVGWIIARCQSDVFTRFRAEAEALANGTGDAIKTRGDEIDQVALAFNELQARMEALRAKQVREDELLAAKRYADNVIKSM